MKELPTGIEDFKELIDKDYYYVDKTAFIKDVCKEKVALYTRPRRFGKTLNMSMLYYFFSIKQKQNAYIFDGLNITEDKEIMKHQNQYPVIYITLKNLKNDTYEKQLDIYGALICGILRNNQELLTSEAINEIDREQLLKYYKKQVSEAELQLGLQFLSECLYQHYQKRVILLIDEYDVPLQDAYLNGYYDKMVNFLKNVFGAALKTNDALEKGILTGCLRIAKESIFTGLNNFKVFSIFDDVSSHSFGFEQSEIDQMLKDYDQLEYRQEIKEWYDGYLFGYDEIYNPWSTLMYVDRLTNSRNKAPASFWANTSGNDIIERYLSKATPQMREEFDILTSGGTLDKTIKSELTYREMDKIDNIYSFLLFTGYLKVVEPIDNYLDIYRLKIPNKEIYKIYETIFKEWFQEQIEHSSEAFAEALMKEDVDKANEILNQILFQSISYFDYDERFYHGILVGLFSDYRVVSNQESGLGRYDIAVLPTFKKKRGLLFELKVSKTEDETQEISEKACQQILDKKYIEGLQRKGYRDIIGYGIAFYKKSCWITSIKDVNK